MPASRQKEERMWNEAYKMARSGEHRTYQSIEWELIEQGYSRARTLLDSEGVREKLNRMCDEARTRQHAS
jgi:hypothetical protein